MPMRYAQRKHIIQSLDSLLYTLHAVSFLLYPSIWAILCRYVVQIQCTRPHAWWPGYSLRVLSILGSNALSVYNHAVESTEAGRAYILDFVGVDHVPSRASLLFLDFAIILLQVILTTISYETSLSRELPPDTPDCLSPEPIPTTPQPPSPLSDHIKPPQFPLHEDGTEYIIDLRLRTLLWRLAHPPPNPSPRQTSRPEDFLPLPNTTAPPSLSASFRMLLRAQRRDRTATRIAEDGRNTASQSSARRELDSRGRGSTEEARRLPGGLGLEDVT
ncbi:hypothetical protein GY45DRAFT_1317504 [Cubamyces sp. BRFM 1775]|nr:hypothetical protein GY45DRAFT_1317504 [Cubamyces sp. BRFM 1775]